MKKTRTAPESGTGRSQRVAKTGRDGSRTRRAAGAYSVSPISERIIKETSVKRAKAMKVLADR